MGLPSKRIQYLVPYCGNVMVLYNSPDIHALKLQGQDAVIAVGASPALGVDVQVVGNKFGKHKSAHLAPACMAHESKA